MLNGDIDPVVDMHGTEAAINKLGFKCVAFPCGCGLMLNNNDTHNENLCLAFIVRVCIEGPSHLSTNGMPGLRAVVCPFILEFESLFLLPKAYHNAEEATLVLQCDCDAGSYVHVNANYAKCQMPNAKRQMPNAKYQILNAKHLKC